MIKKLLPLLLLILIGCSEPEPIRLSQLYPKENQVMYQLNSNRPYSGPVVNQESDMFSQEFISQEEYDKMEEEGVFDMIKWNHNPQMLDVKGQYRNGKRDGSWYYYNTVEPESTRSLKEVHHYKDGKKYRSDFYSSNKLIGSYIFEDGLIIRREP